MSCLLESRAAGARACWQPPTRTHTTLRPPGPTPPPLPAPQGKAVLRKEPMSRDVRAGDVFSVNDAFTSKLYKVKIGMVTAQVHTRSTSAVQGRYNSGVQYAGWAAVR